MTIGGLAGRIEAVQEQTVTLTIATVEGKSVSVRMQRAAVQSVLPKGTLKF